MFVDRRNWLRDRWHLDSEALFLQLLQAYSSGDRYYHTVEHLYHVLSVIEQLDSAVSITLNLAAWFHDAVYDTHAQVDTSRPEGTRILGSSKPLKLDSLQSLAQRWDSPQALIRACPALFAYSNSCLNLQQIRSKMLFV